MAGVLKYGMSVRHPDTLEAVSLAKGEKVPDWAMDAELVHDDDLESASDAKSGSDSEGASHTGTKDELQAKADSRGLEVEGSGSNGNVTKADLVSALEADDASKA